MMPFGDRGTRHTARRALGGLAVAVTLLLPSVRADAASATDFIRGLVSRGLKIFETARDAGNPLGAEPAIRQFIDGHFDLRDAAQGALGSEWRDRTPGERREFTRLFTTLVERNYLATMMGLLGGNARAEDDMSYEGETTHGRGSSTVLTSVTTRRGDATPVEYTVSERDGRWRVVDVTMDHMSLVGNYTAQIRRLRSRGSFDDVVAAMKARAAG
jgi:phospholipid transport system substrate-binding protein